MHAMKFLGKISQNDISMVIGLVMAVIAFLAAIFAPYLAPYDPLEMNMMERLEPMSRLHPLGTDAWGRDMLSRIIFGARYSLVIGVVSVGISLLLGGALGVIGGFYPGSFAATVITWIADVTMAFPAIIIGALVAMILGPGTFNTIIALSVAFFPRFIRLARASTLSIKEEIFITAARSLGMSQLRLLGIHLIPNIISPLLIMAVIWCSTAITLEVGLSFLGLGVPPPEPSWGTILQDNIKYFQMVPMAVIWPCAAIGWTVQAFNLAGDRFRDILDPKMR
jgi:peptide/nickel transport system permease protein